jgi:hypothetical protein
MTTQPREPTHPDDATKELHRLFSYYVANHEDLAPRYNGRYIVIHDCHVVAAFSSQLQSYLYAIANFAPGTFMLHYAAPGKDNYTQHFHSRVRFE